MNLSPKKREFIILKTFVEFVVVDMKDKGVSRILSSGARRRMRSLIRIRNRYICNDVLPGCYGGGSNDRGMRLSVSPSYYVAVSSMYRGARRSCFCKRSRDLSEGIKY